MEKDYLTGSIAAAHLEASSDFQQLLDDHGRVGTGASCPSEAFGRGTGASCPSESYGRGTGAGCPSE